MKQIVGIETAAQMTGVSVRHFRRLIEKDHLRVIQIRRKFFILTKDLSNWGKNTNMQINPLPKEDQTA
jgi:excisionase family DNA binding protein